jgi:methionine salvage enolase-phosphatase E1
MTFDYYEDRTYVDISGTLSDISNSLDTLEPWANEDGDDREHLDDVVTELKEAQRSLRNALASLEEALEIRQEAYKQN